MDLLKRIENLIEDPLAARGYVPVRVQISGARRKVLQIMIERVDEVAINVDDCSKVSRLVSVLLDVQDPLQEAYTLEVSSPGLERPLVKPQDFQRFCNHDVFVSTHQPVQGRKRFQGCLRTADDREIMLDVAQPAGSGTIQAIIELENIRAAHLVINFNNSEKTALR